MLWVLGALNLIVVGWLLTRTTDGDEDASPR